MQTLIEMCVRRPVLTWVLALIVVVVGAFSYTTLGLDKYPKVDLPIVVVTTLLPGAAPAEIESQISERIEAAVNTISGIDELRSSSSEGVSTVSISFALEKNGDVAAQEVRDRIANVLPLLPKDTDPPTVSRVDPDAAPVLTLTLRGPGSLRDLTELADRTVRRSLENIQGVGGVAVVGGARRSVNVWIDPVRLRPFDLTALDVRRAIAAQNMASPAGVLERGPKQLTMRVDGRVTDLAQLRRVVLKVSDGHATVLEDVADVEDGTAEETTWASEDGERVVMLSIRKQSGANTVAVVDGVRARLADVQATLPSGTRLAVARDDSGAIRTSVHAVREHLVIGAVLAALVVLVFLGSARSTVIAALAIPISIVGAFGVIAPLGLSLNMMTLLALALAVGIVIDDAIVVLENVHRFLQRGGATLSPEQATIEATREIAPAVLATTLSLLAVFLPVAFLSGIVGRFLSSFGVTMAASIAVSMLVSLTLTPMLCARWLTSADHAHDVPAKKPRLERLVDAVYGPIERVYLVLLRWSMAHRWVVVGACAIVLGAVVPLAKAVPVSFQAEDDMARFSVEIRLPEGSSLPATKLVAEDAARSLRELPGALHTLLTIGDDAGATPNVGRIHVTLQEPAARTLSQSALMARARQMLAGRLPQGAVLAVGEVSDFGGMGAKVGYTIAGPDLELLGQTATRVVKALRAVPGAVDVQSSLVLGKPELDVAIDRERAAILGVDPTDIASTLQLLVGGAKVSTFTERGEEYDIRARAKRAYRTDDRALLITVPSTVAKSVPLDSVVTLSTREGPAKIERLNRRRQVSITCNPAPGVGEGVLVAELGRIVAAEHLSASYQAGPSGGSREGQKAVKAFAVAFGASFLFMYLVLAAQFDSWLHPVTILVCLPLTVPFALLSLLLLGQQLTIMSALGLLVLFGVVKKNAILQIDHTLKLQRDGTPRAAAIVEANRDRLRPILMTTIAFIAGMLPLVFARGVGAGVNRNIAGVIVGGQALSLLLTLLATPVFYSLFDDVRRWLARPVASAGAAEAPEQPSGAE